MVLNFFAEGSQIQTYNFVGEPHQNFLTQFNLHVLFYSRTKSVTQNIRHFIERMLRATQRVSGSRMRPSEPRLRTTGLHELDRNSQPRRRGCHSRELQDQPLTFCRCFGTASIFSTVFSMHNIGFLLLETGSEWKLELKIPRYYSMSLNKPKAVYPAIHCSRWRRSST